MPFQPTLSREERLRAVAALDAQTPVSTHALARRATSPPSWISISIKFQPTLSREERLVAP